MKLDITIHKGNPDKPAIIFVHGLGMNKNIWVNPDEAKMVGGSLPIKYLLARKPAIEHVPETEESGIRPSRLFAGELPQDLKTSFDDLRQLGYTVISWSQKRPVGSIGIAVDELAAIVKTAKRLSRKGLILIGHSRGGLIARKYLERREGTARGLITLATPHRGSTMAKWVEYISPIASFINPMIRETDRRRVSQSIKRILSFIEGRAIEELLPESAFFQSLAKPDCKKIRCMSFGGTDPKLFTLYRWKVYISGKKRTLKPEPVFSIPGMLEKLIPEKLYPPELKNGYGDGLVSSESSRLPGCKNHYNLRLNHAEILFDKRVRNRIIEAVREA